jgi:hypothetical protein
MNDDHGDQFPGAVPASAVPAAARPTGADDRLVRMSAAYTEKVNAAVQAGRENLAYELAERTFAEEMSGVEMAGDVSPVRRPAGRRTRSHGHRPPTALGRMGKLTRRSLDRFDRYTLDVFNPRPPHALYASRPDRSA